LGTGDDVAGVNRSGNWEIGAGIGVNKRGAMTLNSEDLG